MSDRSGNNVIDTATIFHGVRIAIILSLLISALLIIITIDTEMLVKALESISFKVVLTLILTLLLNWFVSGIRFKIMANTLGEKLSLFDGVRIYLAGAFISNVTPFATGGGPFQIYFLHKKGINLGKASMIILTQFLFRIIFFTTVSSFFLIFYNKYISPGAIPPSIFYTAFVMSFIIGFFILFFALVPGVTNKVINYLFKIKKVKKFISSNYRVKRLLVKGKKELEEFSQSVKLFSTNKVKMSLAFVLTILYWGTIFTIIPLILIGFGLEPHFFRSYIMSTIFYMVIPYMPTPGASGIAEVGFATLFVSFIPAGIIGLVTFLWRFITFYLLLVVGGYFTLHEIGWKRRGNNG